MTIFITHNRSPLVQVKSAGHAMNPGFSSSPGVQIAMYRFNEVNYDRKTQAVEIGTGLNFDDVYAALAPYNVSVTGGRVTGIGVGGFLLGGGMFDVVNAPFEEITQLPRILLESQSKRSSY